MQCSFYKLGRNESNHHIMVRSIFWTVKIPNKFKGYLRNIFDKRKNIYLRRIILINGYALYWKLSIAIVIIIIINSSTINSIN